MARVAELWRSMPLRLAALLIGLFAVVSLISLAASYAVTQRSFVESIRADLRQDLAGFRAAPSARAVALLVEAESREANPNRLILSYRAPSGRIFGNGAIARDSEGFHFFSLGADRTTYRGGYISLTDRLYGGRITIARSRAELEALRDVFINILVISLLPTVLIALSGGLILAKRSKRHVDVIGQALDRMTSGDLAARVTAGPRWSDDMVRIGAKVNEMAGAQETQMRALRGVSSDIAHDLRTPLQRLSVHLEEAASAAEAEGESAARIADARAEADAMAQVFQSLLTLAQVEAGSARARFEPVDLAAIAQTVAEMFEPLAARSDHLLSVEIAAEAEVAGDRALLGQLLANVIENAIRHTPEGTSIEVRLDPGPILSVRDTGPGIPEEEREKVRQRLYRLDRSRATPGYGLGLSMVQAVADLHGAALHLSDAAPGLRVAVDFSGAALAKSATDGPSAS